MSPKKISPTRKSAAGGPYLTTDEGLRLTSTDDSLHAGARGPSLIEDFHLREKITHFDHERIPERVVHARGSAAHGYFQVYQSLSHLTAAKFLCEPGRKTPVFTRFSTVAGPRGSADTVRDVRGFATKFYTDEGNFDLVGNNMPVFFIQDGIKFPDVIHAVKAEPHNEMPTAASAHDSFWDFATLVPESAHMLMWVMSDRGIPRSYRMMEGFGVHTFRLVNAKGKSHLVKFHWKPVLGMSSLVWDEAQKIQGFDCDFHRKDLYEAIANGQPAEWELGLQVVSPEMEAELGFDLLDPTKLIPEEIIPVQRVGKMVLNRNPENAFAETEQVAFCVSHVVPGIEVTDDPLMQARLFSYLDTQLTRLGGPNFAELPINRPLSPVNNHQQDGHMRHTYNKGPGNYTPNTTRGGCPFLATAGQGGYTHFPEPVSGVKTRSRSETFGDHFTQAAMFVQSLTAPEREHLTSACCFELGKVGSVDIRERAVGLFAQFDKRLAKDVARALGIKKIPDAKPPRSVSTSAALSMESSPAPSIYSRRVACLAAKGVNLDNIEELRAALKKKGAMLDVIAPDLQPLGSDGTCADKSLSTVNSVLYDAIYIPDGAKSAQTLAAIPAVQQFVSDTFQHCKAIGANGAGLKLLSGCLPASASQEGVVTSSDRDVDTLIKPFFAAIKSDRHWGRFPPLAG